MRRIPRSLSRREFCAGIAACAAMPSRAFSPLSAADFSPSASKRKIIPASGESLHPIGMGTWITFNVGRDRMLRDQRTRVLSRFFALGGEIVDSSPMYGSSEAVLGYALERLKNDDALFAATKLWTSSAREGRDQFRHSLELWMQRRFALLQVHNLVAWPSHLAFMRELKQEGSIKYIGITTSHGRRHDEMEKIMQQASPDFIQLTYNIADREAERRLLPMAKDLGIAVIANRPFQGGTLFRSVRNKPLPDWHKDVGIENWAQLFLRFVISHPAITCAIPATSRVDHMIENMGACSASPFPDANQRKALGNYLRAV